MWKSKKSLGKKIAETIGFGDSKEDKHILKDLKSGEDETNIEGKKYIVKANLKRNLKVYTKWASIDYFKGIEKLIKDWIISLKE